MITLVITEESAYGSFPTNYYIHSPISLIFFIFLLSHLKTDKKKLYSPATGPCVQHSAIAVTIKIYVNIFRIKETTHTEYTYTNVKYVIQHEPLNP